MKSAPTANNTINHHITDRLQLTPIDQYGTDELFHPNHESTTSDHLCHEHLTQAEPHLGFFFLHMICLITILLPTGLLLTILGTINELATHYLLWRQDCQAWTK